VETHFETVARSASIPILLYNMPAATGVDLSAAAVTRLAETGHLAGIKDSGGDLSKLAAIRGGTPPGFSVLAGSAGFFVPALAAGATGGVLALANIAPAQCLAMWDAARTEAWAKARRLQAGLVALNAAVTRRWGVPGLKAAMDRLGFEGGAPRPPLQRLAVHHVAELEGLLMTVGLIGNRREAVCESDRC
jgi:4-hydroxy-2-oxoglutarate aldolase